MTTLMTWVRGPRSTFKLPIFEKLLQIGLITMSALGH